MSPTLRTTCYALALVGCSTNVDLAGERQKSNASGGEDAGDTVATGGAATGGSSNGGDANGGAAGSGSSSGGASAGGAVGTGGASNGGQPVSADAGCHVGTAPDDLYIMFDQSQSMSTAIANSNPPTTWWQEAQSAIATFVQSPVAAGTGVGIQFFPFGGSIAGTDPNAPTSSCYVPNYVTPEVEIGMLPGNAGAIVQSIENHAPTTFTPTAPALRGAVEHMKDWGPAHPGRQPAVVLVTDGYPTECDPQDPLMIADIAREAYDNTPRVLTFVVALETGESLANLNVIAQAGGTGSVRLIHGADVGGELASQLLGISTTMPSCPP